MTTFLIILGSIFCTASATWNFDKNQSTMNRFMRTFCVIIGISLMTFGSWLVGYDAGVSETTRKMSKTEYKVDDDINNIDTVILLIKQNDK